MVATLDRRAREGRIDVDLMREGMEQVRATGLGQPGLSGSDVENLQRLVLLWAEVAREHPERVEPVARTTAGDEHIRLT